jgi:hypothetical protein
MKAGQTKRAGIAENARTEAAATSAAASAAAVKDDRFILITILQRRGCCQFTIRCQAARPVTCVPSPTGMPGYKLASQWTIA